MCSLNETTFFTRVAPLQICCSRISASAIFASLREPMSRKLYIALFLIEAAVFVPVLFNFGYVAYVVPSAWGVVATVAQLFHAKFVRSLWTLVHVICYALIFYAAARATHWLSFRPAARPARWTRQIIVLVALFSCSFLRVIHYDSIQGRGGTYTFWGACARSLERHRLP